MTLTKFNLVYLGGPFSDETCRYRVIWPSDDNPTLLDFINFIKEGNRNEWGRIEISDKSLPSTYDYANIIEYNNTSHLSKKDMPVFQIIDSKVYHNYLNCKIRSIEAYGGWSMMNYYIQVELLEERSGY